MLYIVHIRSDKRNQGHECDNNEEQHHVLDEECQNDDYDSTDYEAVSGEAVGKVPVGFTIERPWGADSEGEILFVLRKHVAENYENNAEEQHDDHSDVDIQIHHRSVNGNKADDTGKGYDPEHDFECFQTDVASLRIGVSYKYTYELKCRHDERNSEHCKCLR